MILEEGAPPPSLGRFQTSGKPGRSPKADGTGTNWNGHRFLRASAGKDSRSRYEARIAEKRENRPLPGRLQERMARGWETRGHERISRRNPDAA